MAGKRPSFGARISSRVHPSFPLTFIPSPAAGLKLPEDRRPPVVLWPTNLLKSGINWAS